MLGVDERRIKRGEVGAPFVVGTFQGSEGRIDSEQAEDSDDRHYLKPPCVAAQGGTKTSAFNHSPGYNHKKSGGSTFAASGTLRHLISSPNELYTSTCEKIQQFHNAGVIILFLPIRRFCSLGHYQKGKTRTPSWPGAVSIYTLCGKKMQLGLIVGNIHIGDSVGLADEEAARTVV
jgi:hypothetical protein